MRDITRAAILAVSASSSAALIIFGAASLFAPKYLDAKQSGAATLILGLGLMQGSATIRLVPLLMSDSVDHQN